MSIVIRPIWYSVGLSNFRNPQSFATVEQGRDVFHSEPSFWGLYSENADGTQDWINEVKTQNTARALAWVHGMKPADIWATAELASESAARFALNESETHELLEAISETLPA